jgi:chromosome partitioning protein
VAATVLIPPSAILCPGDLGQILDTIRLTRQTWRAGSRLLLTMFDGRVNLAAQVAQDVRRHFRDRVFRTVIPRNVRLAEAPSHGQPVILYDIRCPGAEGYLSLAREVIDGAKARSR